ncbi:MAG: transposase [Richelia sp.]|nr:transposase [Richelia sp.]
MRFLRLGLAELVPDATTVWLFRQHLKQQGLIKKLFEQLI